ncbi:Skp1 family, tetramerization domain [Musa troglodytarum]|uniref:SKP1-like protein n=1 Tax=Musa troglodytarum TaxID=320322 RepID=A0A9E7FFE9_9LILI|nr:Skp1 family, tetramerization domain [Musa troglodytarum]
MITLKSIDGQEFQVEKEACVISEMIKFVADDCDTDDVIPVTNISGKILAKVVEYMNKHLEFASKKRSSDAGKEIAEEEIKAWNNDFIKDVDTDTLYYLLIASDYLSIKGLLDLGVKKAADLIRGKSPEQIRATFNIKNDFTPEEEAEFRKENSWVFDEAI